MNNLSLSLSKEEKAEMIQFYEEELDKTVRRLEHIKSVLEKLEPGSVSIDVHVEAEIKSVGKTKTYTEKKELSAQKKSKRKRKPGPKAIWGNYILKRLRQLDRPVTYSELIQDALLFFKLPPTRKDTVRQAIMNSAFRLRNKQDKVNTFRKKGTKEKYIGLKKWFDAEGKLLSEYLKKIA